MSFPNSYSKNISSHSLNPTPSSVNPTNNNIPQNDNISEKNNIEQIKDNDDNNIESDIGNDSEEIPEEENEEKDDNKNKEKEEDEALKGHQPEGQGKIERLFIYLRTGFTWRPVPKIKSTVLCLEISGAIFIILGIVIIILSNQIKEIEIRYDDNPECTIGNTCNINFTIEENMKKNIFVYYRMKNFHQNHRRYVKSKSLKQLKGEYLSEDDIDDDCDPITLNKDLYEGIRSADNTTVLNPDDVAHPCGLIAKSFFNDTYILKREGNGNEDEIRILNEDIAWSIDKKKFKNSANISKQWINVEDERFIVWMRQAAMPDFRKPWGKIDIDLKKGNYILSIKNNYPVESFDGKKYFILSTVNALGGKNYFLAILYFVLGGVSIVSGIMFWFGYKRYNSNESDNKIQKKE